MDYISLTSRRSAVVLIAALLISCADRQSIFSNLALLHVGLDFPYTLEQLTQCQKNNYEPCLKSYQRVRDAKKLLFSRSREQALQLSFDTIYEECEKPPADLQADLACSGAIAALYFFSTNQDDISIRKFLDQVPSVVLKRLLSECSSWVKNRVNKSAWRQWIATSQLTTEERRTFLIFLDMQADENLTVNHLDDLD